MKRAAFFTGVQAPEFPNQMRMIAVVSVATVVRLYWKRDAELESTERPLPAGWKAPTADRPANHEASAIIAGGYALGDFRSK